MKRALVTLGSAVVMAAGLLVTGPATASAAPSPRSDDAITLQAAACTGTFTVWRGNHGAAIPVNSAGSSNCVMGSGASGSHVRTLQTALVHCHGLNTGGIDGIYGPATTSAVQTLQRRSGITADGVYGPVTRQYVQWRWYAAADPARCARY